MVCDMVPRSYLITLSFILTCSLYEANSSESSALLTRSHVTKNVSSFEAPTVTQMCWSVAWVALRFCNLSSEHSTLMLVLESHFWPLAWALSKAGGPLLLHIAMHRVGDQEKI